MTKRVTFYFDGFNFYFALKRKKDIIPQWKDYYWLDMVSFCESFLGKDQVLEKVLYFTASPLNSRKNSRQSAFLNANRLLHPDKFEVVRGKYMSKQIKCPNCEYSISKPEEKKTDVNISVRMMADCVQDKTDVVVLVSADSDLIPPLQFIHTNYPEKKIKLFFPPGNHSSELRDLLMHYRSKWILLEKNEHRFRDAVMDQTVTVGTQSVSIPKEWKLSNT
jgi:hypothetical protein